MPANKIKSTQEHLDIEDIQNNLVILKDNSCALVIQTSAVNFSLLSEGEQDATIYAYAGLLNSLTFSIQIIIRSQKKNIDSYLSLLNAQEQKLKNPLLKTQLQKYQQFIKNTVQENEVLDKKFYLIIPFSSLELGVTSTVNSVLKKKKESSFDKTQLIQKATTKLIPKRDHLISQLTKLGLKARQLTTPELIKLFYHHYNPQSGSIESFSEENLNTNLVQAAVQQPGPQS